MMPGFSARWVIRATWSAPWLALAALLAAGLPLFLHLPLWADATLYDLAARNVARGGVPYRDIFDTNLPGMLWLHLGVRRLLGDSPTALRLVDVGVFTGVVLLLLGWLRGGGRSLDACGRVAVVLAAFYFSLSEICHCQRDFWMLLPALAALHLREKVSGTFSLLEGALWAVAFWIKPFVAVPAVCCFVLGPKRDETAPGPDTKLALLGGAFVLGGGVLWLGAVGALPHLADVFLHWNPEYATQSLSLEQRGRFLLKSNPPWSLVHAVAVPLALVLLWRGRRGAADARPWVLPSAFYLGWLGQAAFLQKGYEYSLASAAPAALVLLAGRDWWPGRFRLGAVALTAFAALAAYRHPLADAERLVLWRPCLAPVGSAEIRDRLRLVRDRNATDEADLERVAGYLRTRGLHDGELTCYNNSTHPLYLMLDRQPSTRYLHFDTLLMCFPSRREEIREALAKSGQRYVVSDTRALPKDAKPGRDEFPWSLPVVFEAGRYRVHEAKKDVGPLMYR